MDTPPLMPEQGSEDLPLGTKVGAWRVSGPRRRGTYGAVYPAVRVGNDEAGPVALKLAIYPRDPRFAREAELLARIRHPSVPRLLDAGQWRHPFGRTYPYLVMEWIEGVPLYEWAARRNPSLREVLRVLAQAAHALQATHELSGVHRDVKGDNMLVRPADGRLFLTDFGSGHFAGAARLTPLPMLPGTPAYRSPEAWDYVQRAEPLATCPVVARPTDDVFALGVTAYRLVTDEHPPFTNPYLEEGQCWRPGGGGPRPPRMLNPRVDAHLNALILRMLAPRPEDRGTAGELAKALERGVAHAMPSAEEPLFEWETLERSKWSEEEVAEAEQLGHRLRHRDREVVRAAAQSDAAARAELVRREAEARARAVASTEQRGARRWLPWLVAVGAVGLWPGERISLRTEEQLAVAPTAPEVMRREGDSVSVGDTALSTSDASVKAPGREAIALEIPKQALPGQIKPDAKGRCRKKQVAINGGCWLKVDLDIEDCPGNGFVYQGECYMPIFASGRQPTSAPRLNEP